MNPNLIEKNIEEHRLAVDIVRKTLQPQIFGAAECICKATQAGHTVFLCGNGGSAADAQHIAAEFTGRFVKERKGLPAVALTTDTSALTAIGNDYGYDQIFARQVEALGKPGDLLIAISTSGNSPNVLAALRAAREKRIVCIGLSGRDGGKMNDLCTYNIVVPSTVTARIQEMHILIGHIFCDFVDAVAEEPHKATSVVS